MTFVRINNRFVGEKITKPLCFNILYFCMITDRPTVKVNYILETSQKVHFTPPPPFNIEIHRYLKNKI